MSSSPYIAYRDSPRMTDYQSLRDNSVKSVAFPYLQTNTNVSNESVAEKKSRRLSKPKVESPSSVNNNNSDYTDVSKIKNQITKYKENVAKTKLLSKPINLIDTFYNLGAFGVNGRHIDFRVLNECVLLVVNVATCDPKTTDEFRQLNQLVNSYNMKGFAVLGFFCNQFNNSQPWDNDEILKSLRHVRPGQKYEPNFPLFVTSDVNGSSTNPVYDYLKLKQPFPHDDFVTLSPTPDNKLLSLTNNVAKYLYPLISWTPVQRSDIGGNFEKFLIDRTGQVVSRYTRRKPISTIMPEIEQLLIKKCREARANISNELANQTNNLF